MLMKAPENVNFVTVLVHVVSIMLINVVDVMLITTYITTFVMPLAQMELIKSKNQPDIVTNVTKDVLSVKMKLITNVLYVTIHGSSITVLNV
jgi:type IV secretory pathway TrbL component